MSALRYFKRHLARMAAVGGGVIASMAFAGPAWAAPVSVGFKDAQGVLEAGIEVVAFSYDAKRLYPLVLTRMNASRPVPATRKASLAPLPRLTSWPSFSLVHSFELERFREGFKVAHASERALLDTLMPAFDEVFKKYGDQPVDLGAGAIFSKVNGRQVWCQHVTEDLNRIIDRYNDSQGLGDSGDTAFQVQMAEWLGRRNDALRREVLRLGGRAEVGFVQSATDENGLAAFDLSPGVWYVACQKGEGRYWYKALRVSARGGHISLGATDLQSGTLALGEWTGS